MIKLERLAPVTGHFRGQVLRESAGHSRAAETVPRRRLAGFSVTVRLRHIL